jgi:hypothetical protein
VTGLTAASSCLAVRTPAARISVLVAFHPACQPKVRGQSGPHGECQKVSQNGLKLDPTQGQKTQHLSSKDLRSVAK